MGAQKLLRDERPRADMEGDQPRPRRSDSAATCRWARASRRASLSRERRREQLRQHHHDQRVAEGGRHDLRRHRRRQRADDGRRRRDVDRPHAALPVSRTRRGAELREQGPRVAARRARRVRGVRRPLGRRHAAVPVPDDDGGATWRSIAGDLPAWKPVKTVEEDPRNPNVLYARHASSACTGRSTAAALDASRPGNMPPVMVTRIIVDERDRRPRRRHARPRRHHPRRRVAARRRRSRPTWAARCARSSRSTPPCRRSGSASFRSPAATSSWRRTGREGTYITYGVRNDAPRARKARGRA